MKNIPLILMIISYPGLFVSLVVAVKIRKEVISTRLKKYWLVVLIMNIFFIFTFAGYIYILMQGRGISGDLWINTMISTMLFMGGSWVAFLTKVVDLSSLEKVSESIMIEKEQQLKKINTELEEELMEKTKQLKLKTDEAQEMIYVMDGSAKEVLELNDELKNLKTQL